MTADTAWRELRRERERRQALQTQLEQAQSKHAELEQRAARQARNFDLLNAKVKNADTGRVQRMFSREYDDEMTDRAEDARVSFADWLQEVKADEAFSGFFTPAQTPAAPPAPTPTDSPDAPPTHRRPPAPNPNHGASNDGSGSGGDARLSDQQLRAMMNSRRPLTATEQARLDAELVARGFKAG